MDNKTKDAIKQLQAELRQVQVALAERPVIAPISIPAMTEPVLAERKPKKDALVRCDVNFEGRNGNLGTIAVTSAQVADVSDEDVAGIAYALSSPHKVALLRALLNTASEGSATLGAQTNLTTGSLYHHLRDLMHARLISQAARNQYAITDRGIRVLLVLLALAAEA